MAKWDNQQINSTCDPLTYDPHPDMCPFAVSGSIDRGWWLLKCEALIFIAQYYYYYYMKLLKKVTMLDFSKNQALIAVVSPWVVDSVIWALVAADHTPLPSRGQEKQGPIASSCTVGKLPTETVRLAGISRKT